MEKLKEWWNKLSTQEKIALVLVVAGVAGYALYRRSKSSQSTNNAPNGGASVGQAVDQYGNPLYPTNLGGLYSTSPGGSFSTGTGSGGISITPNFSPPPTTGGGSSSGITQTQYNQPFYTVKQGDTISRIANYFGVTPQAIYALNPGLNLQQYGSNPIPAGTYITVHQAVGENGLPV